MIFLLESWIREKKRLIEIRWSYLNFGNEVFYEEGFGIGNCDEKIVLKLIKRFYLNCYIREIVCGVVGC